MDSPILINSQAESSCDSPDRRRLVTFRLPPPPPKQEEGDQRTCSLEWKTQLGETDRFEDFQLFKINTKCHFFRFVLSVQKSLVSSHIAHQCTFVYSEL